MKSTTALWTELIIGFVMLPLAVGRWLPPLTWIPVLWLVSGLAWRHLASENIATEASHRPLDELKPELKRIVARFLISALFLGAGVALVAPDRFLRFPRDHTTLWLAIMVLYPLLSVFPQELLYRRFFFSRYGAIFRSERVTMIASALLFGWMHLVFRNGLAVALTIPGGFFFASTYRRTGSLRLTCCEHSVYGQLVFTIGLGEFFYHGAVHLPD